MSSLAGNLAVKTVDWPAAQAYYRQAQQAGADEGERRVQEFAEIALSAVLVFQVARVRVRGLGIECINV